jgi:hypothetical protein
VFEEMYVLEYVLWGGVSLSRFGKLVIWLGGVFVWVE